ncbi:MAG: hypothetical protein Q8M17_10665 [Actinomycetota bacterium]|nr:hypothetical protein [Actinomycetota bacterium]
MTTISVLAEVAAERDRAEAKFPNQHLPNGTSEDMWGGDCIAAKALVDFHLERGTATWREVLYEEVTEAFSEENPSLLRAELIQVAAMAVRWIEDLDRVIVEGPE